jgi:hypothetical protein
VGGPRTTALAPMSLMLPAPAVTHRFAGGSTNSPDREVPFTGHGGKYRLTYDWRLMS